MTKLESNHNQSVPSTRPTVDSELKHRVIFKLQQADLRIKRSAWLPDGKKRKPPKGHTDPATHHRPTDIDGNCTLHTGDSLLAIDIDDHSEVPDEIQSQLPDTFTIQSPHGGEHLLYHVPDDRDITSANLSDGAGDIQYDGKYVVCPGSYIDHSECRDRPDCPGHGTDHYLPNDQPIATITEADHPELLNWLRDLGGEQQSESNSSSTTINQQRELSPLNHDAATQASKWVYDNPLSECGNAARNAFHDVLSGGTGGVIDNVDGSIDRSKADYYVLYRLYGAFYTYRGDPKSEAKTNALLVLRYFVQQKPWHKDGQPRKLRSVNNPNQYLDITMDAVVDNYDQGKWFRWFNWESRDDYTRNWGSGPSRLTKATVLTSIRYLTDFDGESAPSTEEFEQEYRIDFDQHPDPEIVGNVLSSYPRQPDHTCTSPNPLIRTGENDQNERESTSNRVFPTKREITEMARLLKEDRKPATYGDALSEMVNDPDPPEPVVHAYCPNRPNGERHIYYIDSDAGERDPQDAEYVKTRDRKLEPVTREPFVDAEEPVQEVSI